MKYRAIGLAGAIALMSHSALTLASDNSVTIFPGEGNKQCSDYSANSVVMQMGTTAPQPAGTVTGADNPYDADSAGESVNYTWTNTGTVVGFSNASTPIDYVVVKGSGNKSPVSVIIYPQGGVKSDGNIKLMVNGSPYPIAAISFCYALGNTPAPPPPPEVIPKCSDLVASGGLDSVGITCPADGKKSIVFNYEIGQPFFNTAGSPIVCTCNTTATQCDPSVPAGQPNACPELVPTSPVEVPVHVEVNNDPYWCTTYAGSTKCYAY